MAKRSASRRNALFPWWIGLAIIAVALAYVGYQFQALNCGPMGYPLQAIVLGILPLVYLTLMYLTFKSQSDDERHN
jgi:hypothetical protein